MFICVQALLCYRLSPAVVQVEGGRVERLKDWIPRIKDLKAKQEKRISSSDPSLDNDGPTLSSIEVPTTPTSHGSMELDDDMTVASHDEGDDDIDDDDDEDEEVAAYGNQRRHTSGGVIKPIKTPWAEEDIRFLIELRAMGMTHSQTAVRLCFLVQFLVRQILPFFEPPPRPLRFFSHSPVSDICLLLCFCVCFAPADASRVCSGLSQPWSRCRREQIRPRGQ